MNESPGLTFSAITFLTSVGLGRRLIQLKAKHIVFSQGDAADAVFYIQKGRVKPTVVSKAGKEATITLLAAGDFVGEEAVVAVRGHRVATATATSNCTVLRIDRHEMIRVVHDEHAFSDLSLHFS